MSRDDIVRAVELAYTGLREERHAATGGDAVAGLHVRDDRLAAVRRQYVGPDRYVAFWREVGKEWESFSYEANEIIVTDESIIVPVKTDASPRGGSGCAMSTSSTSSTGTG